MTSFLLTLLLLLRLAVAECGNNAWLRYAPLPAFLQSQFTLPSSIVALNASHDSPIRTAGQELQKGIEGIFGKTVEISHNGESDSSITVGTIDTYEDAYGSVKLDQTLGKDGFWLNNNGPSVQIIGQNDRGALYGAFEYLSTLAQGNFSKVSYATNPKNQIRWTNE